MGNLCRLLIVLLFLFHSVNSYSVDVAGFLRQASKIATVHEKVHLIASFLNTHRSILTPSQVNRLVEGVKDPGYEQFRRTLMERYIGSEFSRLTPTELSQLRLDKQPVTEMINRVAYQNFVNDYITPLNNFYRSHRAVNKDLFKKAVVKLSAAENAGIYDNAISALLREYSSFLTPEQMKLLLKNYAKEKKATEQWHKEVYGYVRQERFSADELESFLEIFKGPITEHRDNLRQLALEKKFATVMKVTSQHIDDFIAKAGEFEHFGKRLWAYRKFLTKFGNDIGLQQFETLLDSLKLKKNDADVRRGLISDYYRTRAQNLTATNLRRLAKLAGDKGPNSLADHLRVRAIEVTFIDCPANAKQVANANSQ